MTSLITRENALKDGMRIYKKGEFLLELFTAAEKIGIVTEAVELENKLSFRLLRHLSLKRGDVRFLEQLYIALRNIMYIIELYLTSYEFKKAGLAWYDIVEIINQDKKGITNLINRSEEYLQKRLLRVRTKIEKCKRRALLMPSTLGYIEIIKNLDIANTLYASYITSKDFLYEAPIITTHLMPMFIKDNLGFDALRQMTDNISKELDILELFESEDINRLILSYMNQTNQKTFERNLFDVVITNFLFSNVCNEDPKSLVIDKTDAKIIFSEIMSNNLSAKELVNDGIAKLDVPKCKDEYIRKMEKSIGLKISAIKGRHEIGETFIVKI